MWERHENALQYKVGTCVTKKKQRRVASKCKIPPTAPFHTLVRLDVSAPCPFNGAFNFTYKKESKPCEQPHSRVVECMSDSQSLLQFEVCPDEQKSEEEPAAMHTASSADPASVKVEVAATAAPQDDAATAAAGPPSGKHHNHVVT